MPWVKSFTSFQLNNNPYLVFLFVCSIFGIFLGHERKKVLGKLLKRESGRRMQWFRTCLYVGLIAFIREFKGSHFVIWESKVRKHWNRRQKKIFQPKFHRWTNQKINTYSILSNSPRKGNKIRRFSALASVPPPFLQFHIIHTHVSHHTKGNLGTIHGIDHYGRVLYPPLPLLYS